MTIDRPTLSMESIAYQSGIFHKELTAHIADARKRMKSNWGEGYKKERREVKTDLEVDIQICIKKHTGLNITLELDNSPPCIYPPTVDRNSPMLAAYEWMGEYNNQNKNSMKEIRNAVDKKAKGVIDLNACRVSGVFAELDPARMHFDFDIMMGKDYSLQLTPAECSAIVLHETGHVWAMIEWLVRFRTTNVILDHMNRMIDNTVDYDQRVLILKETQDVLQLPEIDAQEIKNLKNETIYTIFLTHLIRKNNSQNQIGIVDSYDLSSFEAMADQFAARHGAGRDIVSGLHKLFSGHIHQRGLLMYFLMEGVKLVVLSASIAGLSFLGLLGWLYLTQMDSSSVKYDKGGYRLKRVKDQLINQLKDKKLSAIDSARIREDIEVIDSLEKEYADRTQLIGLMIDYVWPSAITRRKDIAFQQELETITNNKLFYYSNKFKHA